MPYRADPRSPVLAMQPPQSRQSCRPFTSAANQPPGLYGPMFV